MQKVDMIEVLENMSEPCYFLNSNWEFRFINKAAEPTFLMNNIKTKEELIGKNFWSVVPHYKDTYVHENYLRAYEEQKSNVFELISFYTNRWIEVKLVPNKNGIFITFRDIEDRKESEKQQQYYDRLRIIGEMAAGVAHEVRNPITTIKGFLQLMVEDEEMGKYKSKNMLMIDEVDRINDIITEFLDIANDKPKKVEYCSLNELIKAILPLLETRAIKEGKLLVLKLSTITNLNIDRNEIRQLLLNLINNSLDAMDSGKEIQILTYEAKGKVVLSIIDQGHGIPADVIDDIEIPFFTTKDNGTGLGIPICFSIAKRNNATIDYTTNRKGTRFNIRF
ncbi:ATP-binding protein [Salipaludibacillus sp. CF4.18]|uniref:ATP-binding protein n=1 Tax=Salipaludibacillus sp. CF4.18 TaxID=3373081 RepID=UPI003EE758EE